MFFRAAVMDLVAGAGGWLAFAVVLMGWLLWRRTPATRAEEVARACHELRGPLTAARLGVELSAARPAASVARLRAIELELDRAAVALDDLQGVSRQSEPGLVEVESWLRDSVVAWAPVAARRGATLTLAWEGPPALIEGKRARLAQATGNLIANAIEHGGGAVEVRGRVTVGRLLITICDEGAGLSPELRRWLERGGGRGRIRRPRGAAPGRGRGPGRLWPPAGRGRGPGRLWPPAGRGWGLLIAQTVAVAHGGRLTAQPTKTGARLVLELPLAAPAAQEGGGRQASRLGSRPSVWRFSASPWR